MNCLGFAFSHVNMTSDEEDRFILILFIFQLSENHNLKFYLIKVKKYNIECYITL